MKRRRTILVGALALAAAVAVPMIGRAHDKDKDAKASAVQDATVHFGQRQPQTPDPAPVLAAVTHFLMSNDVTIHKDGTVTFVVNGGGYEPRTFLERSHVRFRQRDGRRRGRQVTGRRRTKKGGQALQPVRLPRSALGVYEACATSGAARRPLGNSMFSVLIL